MVSQIQKVCEKIIVSQYPEIDHVEVEQLGLIGEYYRVTYYIKEDLANRKDYIKIMEDTTTMWRMLTPELRGDILVDFKHVDEEDYSF